MNSIEFLKKYKEVITIPFLYDTITLDFIIAVNDYLFGDIPLRYNRDSYEIKSIEKELEILNQKKDDLSLDEYILYVSKIIALLFMYQIFLDGNRRTSIVLLNIFLIQRKYILFESNIEKLFYEYISIFYYEEDNVSLEMISSIKKAIKPIN